MDLAHDIEHPFKISDILYPARQLFLADAKTDSSS
jgi:hypothetical protein